jgi:hypothetical protein
MREVEVLGPLLPCQQVGVLTDVALKLLDLAAVDARDPLLINS